MKIDVNGVPVTDDARRRDRADLVTAKDTIVAPLPGHKPYRSTHIVELKSAKTKIAQRSVGSRLSEEAAEALFQALEYKRWLMTIPQNRATLQSLGWDIRIPMPYIVMGMTDEFRHNLGNWMKSEHKSSNKGPRCTPSTKCSGQRRRL